MGNNQSVYSCHAPNFCPESDLCSVHFVSGEALPACSFYRTLFAPYLVCTIYIFCCPLAMKMQGKAVDLSSADMFGSVLCSSSIS